VSTPEEGAAPGRRLLALLLLHSAVTQVITFVLRPTSAYRALELDVPTAWLGALTASFAVVPLVLAVPSGQATDRFGERRVMLVGAVLMTLAGAVFALERGGAAGLVLGSVVLGTGHLLSVVGQQAAVANTAGPGRFDTAFGYYTFAASLGQAVGPALITLLGGDGALPDTAPIFATATGLGVVLLACTVFLRMPARERASGAAASGGMGSLLRLPGLVRALLISCVVLAAVDITLVYLPALGADRGRLVRMAGRRRLMIVSVALPAGLVDELDVVMGLGPVISKEQHREQTSSGWAPAASDPGGEDRGDLMDQCSRHAIPPAIRFSSPTGGGTV
jgi:MFS family permease